MNFYETYISKALPDTGNGSNLLDSLELRIVEDPVKEASIISSEVTLKYMFVIGFRITVVHSDQQKVESS